MNLSEKKFRLWELTGFLLVTVFGSLLHFLYDAAGKSQVAALFSPVNESTWEHLKLLYVPFVLFSLVEFLVIGKKQGERFIPAKVFGLLFGMFVIVASFYTYVGIVGTNFLWADILTFVLGVAAAFRYSEKWMANHKGGKGALVAALTLLVVLIVCFVVFTWKAPHIGLFLDPVTKTYGIS